MEIAERLGVEPEEYARQYLASLAAPLVPEPAAPVAEAAVVVGTPPEHVADVNVRRLEERLGEFEAKQRRHDRTIRHLRDDVEALEDR